MDLNAFAHEPQLCLVCGKQTLHVMERGIGGGEQVKVECSSCKSTGTIGNIKPFRGIELSEKELQGLFALAGIEIINTWKLHNGYWNRPDETGDYFPWWLVKTPAGLVEIGWRKRVIDISWNDTDIRAVITKDDVTKSETMVHAWSEEKALEYLKELRRQMTIAALPI